VPSRHVESLGQQLRGSAVGFVLTRALATKLDAIPGAQLLPMGFLMRSTTHVVIPLSVGDEDTVWRDPTVPETLKASSLSLKGHVAILPDGMPIPAMGTASGFKKALADAGCIYPEGYVSNVLDMCLVWSDGTARLFWVKDEPDTVTEFKCLPEGGVAGWSYPARPLGPLPWVSSVAARPAARLQPASHAPALAIFFSSMMM
jgi:hypothetical protein